MNTESLVRPHITRFDQLNTTIMTGLCSFDSETSININTLFHLLPVTRKVIPLPPLKVSKVFGSDTVKIKGKPTTKMKYPENLDYFEGEILALRYNDKCRGVRRSHEVGFFSNNISIDLRLKTKRVNVKLYKTIEITGLKSIQMGWDTCAIIIEKIQYLKRILNIFKHRPSVATMAVDAIIAGHVPTDPSTLMIFTYFQDMTFDIEGDQAIRDECTRLVGFAHQGPIAVGELKITEVTSPMTNLTYYLGFNINRIKFAPMINSYPFECNFSNAADSSSGSAVRVCYYYETIDKNTGKVKQSKHTINVNMSGHVTHSGPGQEAIEPVYNSFIKRIQEIWQDVIVYAGTEKEVRSKECIDMSLQEIVDSHSEQERLLIQLQNNTIPMIASKEDRQVLEPVVLQTAPIPTLLPVMKETIMSPIKKIHRTPVHPAINLRYSKMKIF